MSGLDILVLVLYFGGICIAGVYFSRRNTTTEAYFLGNRNFPAWAIGISLVGTSISSISFLAFPGDAFKTGWLRLLPSLSMPIAILIASIWILPFFRSRNFVSAFEYLELRFGPSTRLYGAIAFIIAQLMRIGFILFLLSLLIHEFSGLPLWVCIVFSGIFVSFYTILGGFEAVVWTDVVQTIVLLIGGVFCLYVIVDALPGGFSQIISEATAADKFSMSEFNVESQTFKSPLWTISLTKKTALMMLLVGLVNWLTEYSSNQNVIQRYCASRTTRDAQKAMWICTISSIPIWSFFMFLGTALWVFYKQFPTPETDGMLVGGIVNGIEMKADQVLPFFIVEQLPNGIAGLVIAAVMAAAMSSLDSSINAISTVSITDIVKRHLKPGQEDSYYLKLAHRIAMATSVFMIVAAIVFAYSPGKTAQDTYTVMVAITAGGLLGLFMLGFVTKSGDGRSIAWAIGCTIAFTLYRVLEGRGFVPAIPIDSYYTGIVGHVLMFVIGWVLGSFMQTTPRDLTNLTLWTRQTTDSEST
ncbi:MAG: sodium:solute symporter [Candidatus Hydrogenedentota bacterium]|nr:MAG: sodium:solute symporter [Candidatus Hydrogenedentota bacterium]